MIFVIAPMISNDTRSRIVGTRNIFFPDIWAV